MTPLSSAPSWEALTLVTLRIQYLVSTLQGCFLPTLTWKIAIMYNSSEITLIREVAGTARLDDGDDNHHSY